LRLMAMILPQPSRACLLPSDWLNPLERTTNAFVTFSLKYNPKEMPLKIFATDDPDSSRMSHY
jgi:hypothetical protein